MSIYWRNMIENVVPQGSDGVIIVFQNECNLTFTFRIYEQEVAYLGCGDKHDPKYNCYLHGWMLLLPFLAAV